MLSPRYLEGLSDEIVEIYAQLEADILQDMALRIARLGKITDATRWQAQLLAETGALKKRLCVYRLFFFVGHVSHYGFVSAFCTHFLYAPKLKGSGATGSGGTFAFACASSSP